MRLRWERVALGAALAWVLVVGLVVVFGRAPLGFDEAVYALRTEDIATGDVRGFYWADVRASGWSLTLVPLWFLGGAGSDVALRAGALLLAGAGIALTWVEARLLFGEKVGAAAAVVLALTPGWLAAGWLVLPDVPGATFALLAVVILTAATRDDRVRWWAVLVAPVAGYATAARYGAPLVIGPALLAVGLLRWPTVRHSLRTMAVTAGATALAVALVWFVPAVTGSPEAPVSIFRGRQDQKDTTLPTRVRDAFDLLPDLVGMAMVLVLAAGLAAAVVAVRRRHTDAAPLLAVLGTGVAVYALLLYGVADLQMRYLTPGLPFAAMTAAVGLVWLGEHLRRPIALGAGAVALAVTAAASFSAVADARDDLRRGYDDLRTASRELGALAGDEPCIVLAVSPQQVQWYSGCATKYVPTLGIGGGRVVGEGITDAADMVRRLDRQIGPDFGVEGVPADAPVYLLIRTGGPREPKGEARDLLLTLSRERVVSGPVTVDALGPADELGDAVDRLRRRTLGHTERSP